MLPGALVGNVGLKFICTPVTLRVESTDSVLTSAATVGQVLKIPLNSYEGNFVADDIKAIEDDGVVILRYSDAEGQTRDSANPNGSTNAIAGVTNAGGNVVGLMPHPERASEQILGSTDGMVLVEGFVESVRSVRV